MPTQIRGGFAPGTSIQGGLSSSEGFTLIDDAPLNFGTDSDLTAKFVANASGGYWLAGDGRAVIPPGVTDFGAAINAAFTALGAGAIVDVSSLKGATGSVATKIAFTAARQSLVASPGSAILQAHADLEDDVILGNALADLTIRGVTVDGNRANQTANKVGIHLTSCTSPRVLDVEVRECGDHGIDLESCSYGLVMGCHSHDNGRAGTTVAAGGIRLNSCLGTRVVGNHCEDNGTHGDFASNDGDGIKVQGGNDTGDSYFNVIEGNVCRRNARRGIKVQAASTVVVGNVCEDNSSAGIMYVNLGGGGSCVGNVVRNNFYGVLVDLSRHVTITGNEIVGNSYYGVWVEHSSTTDPNTSAPAHSVVIQDNVIRSNGRDGIRLEGCADVSVLGNQVVDNGTEVASYHGIRLMDGLGSIACARILIAGNRVYNTATGQQQTGINVLGASTDIQIVGNHVYKNASSQINNGSTGRVFYSFNPTLDAAGSPAYSGLAGALIPGSLKLKNQGVGSDPELTANSGSQALDLTGHFQPSADNTYQIGGASRRPSSVITAQLSVIGTAGDANPKVAVTGTGVSFGEGGASGVDVLLQRGAADRLDLASGDSLHLSGGHVEFEEVADPAAPSSNNARLYVRDNGAGKTQLVVLFPTGAVQVIATEP